MTNVRTLPGAPSPTGEVNEVLVKVLEGLLEHAKRGEIHSYVGTGFSSDGKQRVSTWCDHHTDVYQMLGAIAWLEHEYVHRHTSDED